MLRDIEERPRILAWRQEAPESEELVLFVEWEADNRPPRWMREWNVQERYPEALYEFWAGFNGGRDAATGLEYYHVFALTKHRGQAGHRDFWVQWVGFDEDEGEWKSEEVLRDEAEGYVEEYLEEMT